MKCSRHTISMMNLMDSGCTRIFLILCQKIRIRIDILAIFDENKSNEKGNQTADKKIESTSIYQNKNRFIFRVVYRKVVVSNGYEK